MFSKMYLCYTEKQSNGYGHLYLFLLVTCENTDGFIFKVGINVMPGEGIAPS
jgi:hypothetical protein